jgi:hypothetical protein
MLGMFKSENIVVTKGITRCKLKQGSKIIFFNSNTLIEFTKASCTFVRNNELHLLNPRGKSFKHIFICILYHFS